MTLFMYFSAANAKSLIIKSYFTPPIKIIKMAYKNHLLAKYSDIDSGQEAISTKI